MFLQPLSKCSGGFPYIFLITLYPITFVPIDDSTLFHERIFVLGNHQEAFDGITSFKVYLHSIFLACSFEAFTQPFIIFLNHITSIDKNIQFTSEEPRPDGSIQFLDILLTPGVDGSITTSVFRKHTHTDLYMQWDSHHAISSKYSKYFVRAPTRQPRRFLLMFYVFL